jgi:hypothetical protein
LLYNDLYRNKTLKNLWFKKGKVPSGFQWLMIWKLMKWKVDEKVEKMKNLWNEKSMKSKVDEIKSWWNQKLMKSKVDEIKSWWNQKLMKLKVDEIKRRQN